AGKIHLRIVLMKCRDRNVYLVVARLAEYLTEWFHYADDLEGTTRNFQLFIKRILVREQRADHVLTNNTDVGPVFNIKIRNVPPIADIVRQSKLVIGRDAQQDRRIALLILVANGLSDLAIEGRNAGDWRRLTA